MKYLRNAVKWRRPCPKELQFVLIAENVEQLINGCVLKTLQGGILSRACAKCTYFLSPLVLTGNPPRPLVYTILRSRSTKVKSFL